MVDYKYPTPTSRNLKPGDIYVQSGRGTPSPYLITEILRDGFIYICDTSKCGTSYARSRGLFLRANNMGKLELIACTEPFVGELNLNRKAKARANKFPLNVS